MNLGSVINFSDSMIFAMSVPKYNRTLFFIFRVKKRFEKLGEQSD